MLRLGRIRRRFGECKTYRGGDPCFVARRENELVINQVNESEPRNPMARAKPCVEREGGSA